MPAVTAIRLTFAGDGVTPNGIGITPSDGGVEFIFNVSNSLGATPSAVETSLQNLAATQLPALKVFCHCFSVNPFSVKLFVCDPGNIPPNATWWLGI